jgi:hypothetical protein
VKKQHGYLMMLDIFEHPWNKRHKWHIVLRAIYPDWILSRRPFALKTMERYVKTFSYEWAMPSPPPEHTHVERPFQVNQFLESVVRSKNYTTPQIKHTTEMSKVLLKRARVYSRLSFDWRDIGNRLPNIRPGVPPKDVIAGVQATTLHRSKFLYYPHPTKTPHSWHMAYNPRVKAERTPQLSLIRKLYTNKEYLKELKNETLLGKYNNLTKDGIAYINKLLYYI